jgi:hypothetical protein
MLWNCNKEECTTPPDVKDQAFSIQENSPAKTVVGKVVSSPSDVKFSIVGGDPNEAFAIDSIGAISIKDSAQIDFEKITQFELAIKAKYKDTETTATVVVKITDMGPPTNAQTSYYTFQGNASDQVSTNNGSINFVAFSAKNTAGNLAAEFDGYGNLGFTTPFDYPKRTVSLWFQIVEIGSELQIIYSCDNENNSYGMTILSVLKDGASINLIYNVSNVLNAIAVKKNLWYNAVFVVSDKTFSLYLNGKKFHDESFSTYTNSYNSTYPMVLGASRVGDRNFYGNIDDMRIFNRALTSREVELLFYEELK